MKNASPSYTSSLDWVFSLGVAGIGGNGERFSNILKKRYLCLLVTDYIDYNLYIMKLYFDIKSYGGGDVAAGVVLEGGNAGCRKGASMAAIIASTSCFGTLGTCVWTWVHKGMSINVISY